MKKTIDHKSKPKPLEGKEIIFQDFFMINYFKVGNKLEAEFYIDSINPAITITGKPSEVNKILYSLILKCRTHRDLDGYTLVNKLLRRAQLYQKRMSKKNE